MEDRLTILRIWVPQTRDDPRLMLSAWAVCMGKLDVVRPAFRRISDQRPCCRSADCCCQNLIVGCRDSPFYLASGHSAFPSAEIAVRFRFSGWDPFACRWNPILVSLVYSP